MQNMAKHKLVQKYGKTTTGIAVVCLAVLILNSIFISKSSLAAISENSFIAWIMNFLAGCEGYLGKIGSMSKAEVFGNGQWWRVLTHVYLHAGVLHCLFNVFALLFSGKAVERKLGSLRALIMFHLIAVVNAVIMCLLYPSSTAVGASAGVFGFLGMLVCFMAMDKSKAKEYLSRGHAIYLVIFSVLSLVLGMESFITHLMAFALGILAGALLRASRIA